MTDNAEPSVTESKTFNGVPDICVRGVVSRIKRLSNHDLFRFTAGDNDQSQAAALAATGIPPSEFQNLPPTRGSLHWADGPALRCATISGREVTAEKLFQSQSVSLIFFRSHLLTKLEQASGVASKLSFSVFRLVCVILIVPSAGVSHREKIREILGSSTNVVGGTGPRGLFGDVELSTDRHVNDYGVPMKS